MILAHFKIQQSGARFVATCHCHHPIGAWTRAELEQKIRSL